MKPGNLVALVALGCFCTLAAFSYGRYAPYQPSHAVKQSAEPVVLRPAHGYSDSDRQAMEKLLARVEREQDDRKELAKMLDLYPSQDTTREERIAASGDDVEVNATRLWGEYTRPGFKRVFQ